MEGTVGIEVAADGVSMKCSEDDVVKFSRNQCETSVRVVIADWLAEYDEAILQHEMRLAERATQRVVDIRIDHGLSGD